MSVQANTVADAIASVDSTSSRAIIEIPGTKKRYTFSPDEGLKEAGNTSFGMFLQPALAKQMGGLVYTRSAGEYPFTELQEELRFQLRKRDALTQFLDSLNPDYPWHTRKHRAGMAEESFKDEKIAQELRTTLLGQPMPAEFEVEHGPVQGNAGEILQEMVKKFRT